MIWTKICVHDGTFNMSNLHMNQFFTEVLQQTDIILYNSTIFEFFIFFQFKYLQIFNLRDVEVLFEYSSMILYLDYFINSTQLLHVKSQFLYLNIYTYYHAFNTKIMMPQINLQAYTL